MTSDGGFWVIAVIAGPIILILALLCVIFHNHRLFAQLQKAERATPDLYEQLDRQDGAAEAPRSSRDG